tara:strand:- start:1014 stop:1268 length:255 start_codon:yes stop_codon:yes gene_type:complete
MRGIFKFFAIFLGTFFTSGLISCSSDDDASSRQCCTYSYIDQGITYTYTYCPDGTYTYSIDGEVIYSGTWDDWGTWEEVSSYCD